ncbi:VOC family protein [Bdellovibrio sp. 22V]|uniref:VOC family protein n=1 Tax=Bdellovibrio sp. 22V TaxID=3044166 RepID=UPI0025431F8E|nr:VOC family protein [Bdellovibrio sp. 22V]WII72060.1 VOC family protein [Bdellovibrio sp. 22V]
MQKLTTFLMFEGRAEEAIRFYISLFKNSEIKDLKKYGKEGPGKEGSVLHATFSLNGQEFMAIDSYVKHAFTFTPSVSIYVQCESEEELTTLANKLGENGQVLMPLDNYGFSQKFTWVNDRFGVSWQLNLA